jgi:hypothetical protein
MALFAIIAMAGFGFAAANTVPESGAGDGEGDISGYTVSNIDYTLSSADPSVISAVSFDLDATDGAGQPETVKITLVEDSTAFSDCTYQSGDGPWLFSCNTNVAVATADELRVIAVE